MPMNVSIPIAIRRKPAPRHINPAKARNSPETMIRTVTPAGISQKKWSPSRKKRAPVKCCFRINRPRSRKPLTNPIHKAINNTVPGTDHATNEPFPVLLISSATPAGSFGPIRNLIPLPMNADDFAKAPATSILARLLVIGYRRIVEKRMSPKRQVCHSRNARQPVSSTRPSSSESFDNHDRLVLEGIASMESTPTKTAARRPHWPGSPIPDGRGSAGDLVRRLRGLSRSGTDRLQETLFESRGVFSSVREISHGLSP